MLLKNPNPSNSNLCFFLLLIQFVDQGMEEIIEDYEQGGREESGYVVMDVRGKSEESLSNIEI